MLCPKESVVQAPRVPLDEEFGALRVPHRVEPWEEGRVPKSRELLTPEVGKKLRDLRLAAATPLLRYSVKTVTYIWAMDERGDVFIAVEELAEMPDGSRIEGYPRRKNFPVHPAEEKKLGHPTLVGGGRARLAGELFLDELAGELLWFVNVSSGRYCRFSPPTLEQAKRILKKFQLLIEADVRLDDIGCT